MNNVSSNPAVKRHIQATHELFPHKRVVRKSVMTAKGLVVTEEQEDISGLPTSSDASSSSDGNSHGSSQVDANESPASPKTKSPIAELLYMRWLEGLRIKWPSIMSSS